MSFDEGCSDDRRTTLPVENLQGVVHGDGKSVSRENSPSQNTPEVLLSERRKSGSQRTHRLAIERSDCALSTITMIVDQVDCVRACEEIAQLPLVCLNKPFHHVLACIKRPCSASNVQFSCSQINSDQAQYRLLRAFPWTGHYFHCCKSCYLPSNPSPPFTSPTR